MKNFWCGRVLKLAVYSLSLALAICFVAVQVSALPLQTFDATGLPVDTSAEIAKDPDAFVALMKLELTRGNIDSAGYFAEKLVSLRPENVESQAILSLTLAAAGRVDQAREHLKRARQLQADSFFTLIAEAMLLQREKEYDKAITKCEQAIAADSSHPYPHNILGRIYTDIGQLGKAQDSFQKSVDLNPDFLLGYTNLGAVAFLMGDNQRALAAFSKAIKLNPQAHAAYFGIAVILEAMEANAEAILALQKSLEYNPGDENALESLGRLQLKAGMVEAAVQTGKEMEQKGMEGAHILLGDSLLQAGKTDEARAYLHQADPNSPEVLYLLGYSEMVQGRYDVAKKFMEEVLQKEPRHFGAYSARAVLKMILTEPIDPKEDLVNHWSPSLGRLLHFISGCLAVSEKDWGKAFEDFQASEGMISGFSLTGIDQATFTEGIDDREAIHLGLGVMYYFKKLHTSSLNEFTKAIEINKYSILGNYWLAQVWLQKGDRQQALQSFEQATQKAPSFFGALYAIGELHFLAGKPEIAATYYQQALSVHQDVGLLIKLGLYYENIGKPDNAARYYQQTIDAFPTFFVGYNQLAWLYAKQGIELEKALRLAENADELQPDNASILDTIGWIHFQRKEYDLAVQYLERSRTINPNNPVVLYHLGHALLLLGKTEAAKVELSKALEISTSFEGAEEAKKLLE